MARLPFAALLLTAATVRADAPADTDARRGAVRGERVSLFGLADEQPARSVVYVVHRSASLDPIEDLVKSELSGAVNRLEAHQKFDLLWFMVNDTAKPSAALRPAVDAEKAALRKELKDVVFRGAGDPRAALSEALALKPDVIYVLTDGNFETEFVDAVTKRNAGRTRIHAIALDLDGPEGWTNLAKMAKDNGGRFKRVNVIKLLEKPGGEK